MEWIGTTYCMQVPLYFGIGSIIPVSYTNLDVYKRQLRLPSEGILPPLSAFLLGGDLRRQQRVGDRDGNHRSRRRTDDDGGQGDGQGFGKKLESHLAFAHADGGEHAHLIFSIPNVEEVADYPYHRADSENHQQEIEGDGCLLYTSYQRPQ